MPYVDIVEGSPVSGDPVSNFPALEQAFRTAVINAFNREHDLPAAGGSVLHKFGVGNDATRDATTDWVVGSIFLNTKTTPVTLQRVVSIGPVVWEDVAGGGISLSTANNWTAAQTTTLTAAGTAGTLVSTDAGAAQGPTFVLYRNSASPANSDVLGGLTWDGNSSTGTRRSVANILAAFTDTTNASEDIELRLQTIVAGTLATRATLGAGLYMAGATGGDKGAGTINATALYINNTAVSNVQAASQAEMESASSTTVYVSPGRAHNHPGAAKAWIKANGATGATLASYNSGGFSRSGTGTYTWTIGTDFSSANWCCIALPSSTSFTVLQATITAQAAGSVSIEVVDDSGTLRDCDTLHIVGYGDQ